MEMLNYTPLIPKEQLIKGAYYVGRCRNATVARWNGKEFVHWRYKFGHTYLETINCPEDEQHYDVFVAEKLLDLRDLEKEIPLV